MPLRYREDRATQAAARFLKLRGGRMSYLKLMKLLYLADRKALVDLGRPITYDAFFSMPQGPVLSRTLDLIGEEPPPQGGPSYWRQVIAPPENWEVALRRPNAAIPNDQLSEADEQIIDSIFGEFGHRSRWELVEYTHTLPEYEDPEGSSIPIPVERILRVSGMDADDIEAIKDALAHETLVSRIVD
jgi:uncharacterized phage-associated protein